MGQACEKVSLSSPVTVCEPAAQGLKTCTVDTDCPGNNEVCCNIYSKGLCTAANECPKSCAMSTDCNTQSGEVCCTTVKQIDPSITATGLCLNPQYGSACPKACPNGDSDCASTGQLCCNGICSSTCPKSCNQSSDCDQQICCTSYKASLPPGPTLFHTGPTCTGTPTYATCQQCMSSRGSCTYCPGCGAEAGTGICEGSPNAFDCTTCGQSYNCNCLGCVPGPSSCSGSLFYSCSQWSDPVSCAAELGCSWSDAGLSCTGTPSACTFYTSQSTCQAQGCTWSASCSGTVTPCSGITNPSSCQQQGCSYITGSSSCVGSLTPCSQLTPTTCSTQEGCVLTQ